MDIDALEEEKMLEQMPRVIDLMRQGIEARDWIKIQEAADIIGVETFVMKPRNGKPHVGDEAIRAAIKR